MREQYSEPEQGSSQDVARHRPEPEDVLASVREGMAVRDSAGEHIGRVVVVYNSHIVDAQEAQIVDAYLKVDTGFLGKDLYVPGRFVGEVTDDGIQLTVNKDLIPDLVWDRPETIPE